MYALCLHVCIHVLCVCMHVYRCVCAYFSCIKETNQTLLASVPSWLNKSKAPLPWKLTGKAIHVCVCFLPTCTEEKDQIALMYLKH